MVLNNQENKRRVNYIESYTTGNRKLWKKIKTSLFCWIIYFHSCQCSKVFISLAIFSINYLCADNLRTRRMLKLCQSVLIKKKYLNALVEGTEKQVDLSLLI